MDRYKYKKRLLILLGILLGLLLSTFPAAIFMLMLIVITGMLIWRFSNPEDRKFLLAIFITGITLRLLISTLLQLFLAYNNIGYKRYDAVAPDLFGDSGWYSIRGGLIAEYLRGRLDDWAGDPPRGLFFESYVGYNFYIHALFYYLFGFAQLSVKFINCLFGTISAIIIYYITLQTFNRTAAKLACFLTMFFPSLFLWSLTNLRETPLILLICLIIWSTIKFSYVKRPHYLFIIVICSLLITFIKPYFRQPLIVSLLFSSFLLLKRGSVRKIFIILLMVILISNIFGYNLISRGKKFIASQIRTMIVMNRGFISEGGLTYKIYEERFYSSEPESKFPPTIRPLGFTVSFLKGWVYFLFVPFPWNINITPYLIVYPQIILWYFLAAFSFLGIAHSLRHANKNVLIILTYVFFIGTSLALVSGNVGTVFRHRDVIIALLLILSSIGIVNLFGVENVEV